MGSAYSYTNLNKRDCTSFDAGHTGTTARLGASFEVSLRNRKECDDNGYTQVWGVNYTTGQKKHSRCSYELKAKCSNHKGVESINFVFGDHSVEDKTEFEVNMTSVSPPGFAGGMRAVSSSSGAAPVSSTRAKESYATETTIVSYGCPLRDGLFVLQKKKETVNSVRAYMVTLAHYYVTKDIGLSTEATLFRNINDGRLSIEVKGPFKHPSADLRNVIAVTCRTKEWAPNACSHCYGVPNNSIILKAHDQSNHPGEDKDAIGQGHNQPIISSIVKEQHFKGAINSTGYTAGTLNHSIMILKSCSFEPNSNLMDWVQSVLGP